VRRGQPHLQSSQPSASHSEAATGFMVAALVLAEAAGLAYFEALVVESPLAILWQWRSQSLSL